MLQIPWHIVTRGVAATLIAIAVVIIFLLIEAYWEIGSELPIPHSDSKSMRQAKPFAKRKAL